VAKELIALEPDDTNNDDAPIELPVAQESYSVRRFQGQTGEKIENSSVRYEVVRMITDGMTYPEIVNNLFTHFNFHVAELTVAAFKRNFLHFYQERIDRWDRQRYQYLVARITEEMKEASRKMIHEVYELQHLVGMIDGRINLIQNREDMQNAAYEAQLRGYLQLKAELLKRLSEITGSTGMDQRLKDVVKQTALAAQKTLTPYLKDDRREDAFVLFDQEIEDILISIEAGSSPKAKALTK
jgi:hypothetical protein